MDDKKYNRPAFDDTNIEEEQKKFINRDNNRAPNRNEKENEEDFFDFLKRLKYKNKDRAVKTTNISKKLLDEKMCDNEKRKLLEEEVKEKYYLYFDYIEAHPPLNEKESNKVSREFYQEIKKYIEKRKKELNID